MGAMMAEKNNRRQQSAKEAASTLVKNIKDVEFIIVDNEVEALLLENKLISLFRN